jgi:pimeloyl-ACP methyl ester carboxylesterase
MILNAAERGAGAPVVLLHGLFGRGQNFGTLARRLAERHRVICLDLRNHGASPHTPGMSYEAMAADVLETLAQLGITRASVLGHSMGGKVAMVAALTCPVAIDRLVVADIAPVAYRHSNAAAAAALLSLPLTPGLQRSEADHHLAETIADPSVRAFLLQNLTLGEAPAWRIGLQDIAADMRLIEGFPTLPPGASFTGPTLFIRGETSGYVKDSARPAIEALFPASRIETLSAAGHWLHADQPAAFAAAVEAFLSGHP